MREHDGTDRSIRNTLGAIFAVYFAQTVFFVSVPVAAVRAGASPTVIGLLLAIPGGVSLAIDVPLASRSDARGRRSSMLAGGVVLLCAGVVLLASDVPALAVGAGLYGVAMAFAAAPVLALLTESTPLERQPRVQGWNGSVQALASIAGAAAAGALLMGPSSAPFVAVAVAGAVLTLIALRSPRDQRTEPVARPLHAFRTALSLFAKPEVRAAGILGLAFGLLFLVIGNAFVPYLLVTEVAYSAAAVGLLLGVRPLIVLVGSPLFEKAATRYGVLPSVAVSTLVGAAGVAVLPLVAFSAPGVVLALALQGAGIALSAAAANYLLAGVTSATQRAVAIATTNLGSRLVVLTIPPILGFIYEIGGAGIAFACGAVLVSLCAGALILQRGGQPRLGVLGT